MNGEYIGSLVASGGGGGGTGVQSDYNQNDSTAPDYIKNRPFYEDGNDIEFFTGDWGWLSTSKPQQKISSGEYFEPSVGDMLNITYNGVLYEGLEVEEAELTPEYSIIYTGNLKDALKRGVRSTSWDFIESLDDSDLPLCFIFEDGLEIDFKYSDNNVEEFIVTSSDSENSYTLPVDKSDSTYETIPYWVFPGDYQDNVDIFQPEVDKILTVYSGDEEYSGQWSYYSGESYEQWVVEATSQLGNMCSIMISSDDIFGESRAIFTTYGGVNEIVHYVIPLGGIHQIDEKFIPDNIKFDPANMELVTDSVTLNTPQADWNQNDSTAQDYIKNKPTIPTSDKYELKRFRYNGTAFVGTLFKNDDASNGTFYCEIDYIAPDASVTNSTYTFVASNGNFNFNYTIPSAFNTKPHGSFVFLLLPSSGATKIIYSYPFTISNTASSIVSGDNGYTTGDQVYNALPQTVAVSGETPSITAEDNRRYVCGIVSTLSIIPPVSGMCDIVFTSGATATVLTIPNTVTWVGSFDPTNLETNMKYELNIMDGIGVAIATELSV